MLRRMLLAFLPAALLAKEAAADPLIFMMGKYMPISPAPQRAQEPKVMARQIANPGETPVSITILGTPYGDYTFKLPAHTCFSNDLNPGELDPGLPFRVDTPAAWVVVTELGDHGRLWTKIVAGPQSEYEASLPPSLVEDITGAA